MKRLSSIYSFRNQHILSASSNIYALIDNLEPDTFLVLYILHYDILIENQEKFLQLLSKFSNVKCMFINIEHITNKIKNKKNYTSLSMSYVCGYVIKKILLRYKEILITNRNFIYLNNLSNIYKHFKLDEDYYITTLQEDLEKSILANWNPEKYSSEFINEEIRNCNGSAGYLVFDTKHLLEENRLKQFTDYIIPSSIQ